MQIDIQTEPLIRLTEAARLAGPGRGNRPTHLSTILRWILDGVRTASGERVKLEAVRVGSAWKTTAHAMQRFLAALTPSTNSPSVPRTPTARTRENKRAERRLATAGI